MAARRGVAISASRSLDRPDKRVRRLSIEAPTFGRWHMSLLLILLIVLLVLAAAGGGIFVSNLLWLLLIVALVVLVVGLFTGRSTV